MIVWLFAANAAVTVVFAVTFDRMYGAFAVMLPFDAVTLAMLYPALAVTVSVAVPPVRIVAGPVAAPPAGGEAE